MDKLTVGRRKAAVARGSIKAGNGTITVNGKDYKDFFLMHICKTRWKHL
jgi:ribosomal protein S9